MMIIDTGCEALCLQRLLTLSMLAGRLTLTHMGFAMSSFLHIYAQDGFPVLELYVGQLLSHLASRFEVLSCPRL